MEKGLPFLMDGKGEDSHRATWVEMARSILGRLEVPTLFTDFVSSLAFPEGGELIPDWLLADWHCVVLSAWACHHQKDIGFPRGRFKQEAEAFCGKQGLPIQRLFGTHSLASIDAMKKDILAARKIGERNKVALEIWTQGQKAAKTRLSKGFATQKKRFQKEYRGLETAFQKELDQARFSLVAELAAGAGHEINNPLAILLGRVDSLIREKSRFLVEDPENEALRRLQSIRDQALRIRELIRKLMRIGRPGKGNVATLDLAQELAPKVMAWKISAATKGVEFSSNIVAPGTSRLALSMDKDYLGVILEELIQNAFHFTEAGNRLGLEIRAGKKSDELPNWGKKLVISIFNQGPPLEKTVKNHLFDPFFSHRKAGRGPGLGLPLAKSLARVSGGDLVLFRDGVDGFIEFRLVFPAKAGIKGKKNQEPISGPGDAISCKAA